MFEGLSVFKINHKLYLATGGEFESERGRSNEFWRGKTVRKCFEYEVMLLLESGRSGWREWILGIQGRLWIPRLQFDLSHKDPWLVGSGPVGRGGIFF